MRVLVTGGAGFIGSHCVDALLERGHHVTVVDDFSTGVESNLDKARQIAAQRKLELVVVRGSVADANLWLSVGRHDALFHFAAQVSVVKSIESPQVDFGTNAGAAPAMLDWVRSKRVTRVLYANTAGAIYGDSKKLPTTEDHLIQPLSPYGATKASFEIYLAAVCRSLKASGAWTSQATDPNFFSWVSLRLANVYGPRQTPKGEAGVVPVFFEALLKGQAPRIFGDGSKTRDYVYVGDVVSAFMAAFDKLQSESIDDFFNVGTGVETNDRAVFDTILAAVRDYARRPENVRLLSMSQRVTIPEYAPLRPGEVHRSVLDATKLQKAFGWKAQTDFAMGVRRTVDAGCRASNAALAPKVA